MKTGTLLGWLGCILWMLNFATLSKPEWIGMVVGITSIGLLMAGTIIIGAEKKRMRLGFGLALLSVVFGIGFLIMLFVPKREAQHADVLF